MPKVGPSSDAYRIENQITMAAKRATEYIARNSLPKWLKHKQESPSVRLLPDKKLTRAE